MDNDRRRHDDHDGLADALERLRIVLDAYGANARRWPAKEREALQALLARSAAARALRRAAKHVDDILDEVAVQPPSAQLLARVLAAAPARRPQRRTRWDVRVWRYAGGVAALAAAAAAVFWLVSTPQQLSPLPAQYAVDDFGVYRTPTDVLLGPPSFDLLGSVPSIGCSDGGLACIDNAAAEPLGSRSEKLGRHAA